MHYVFVVMTTRFSENTALVEIRGVFEHMYMASRYATELRGEGVLAPRITRHQVIQGPDRATFTLGQPVPAFPERSVQPVPSAGQ